MNMDCFMKRFCDVLMNSAHDDTFETLKILTGGTTSTRISKLLNFAVSQMDHDECYVEVGVFTGATLCSAAYTNAKQTIGIDKYDPTELAGMGCKDPSVIRDRALFSISSLKVGSRLIEKDFRDVTKEEIGLPVAVSFVDGKHDYADVTANLEWLEPLLADNAIIVFDDVNYKEVSQVIFEWLASHKESYEMLAYVKPFIQSENYSTSLTDRFLNNGVCILHYFKNPAHKRWIETFTLKGGN